MSWIVKVKGKFNREGGKIFRGEGTTNTKVLRPKRACCMLGKVSECWAFKVGWETTDHIG